MLVPRAPGETPAWWAVLGLLDHKAKEGQGDLPDSSDSREKPAIREKPGQQALREIQGLRELPGPRPTGSLRDRNDFSGLEF